KTFTLSILVVATLIGCKVRRPEAASGLLDSEDSEISLSCASAAGEKWMLGIAGWNPEPSAGQPAWVRLTQTEKTLIDEEAIVHYKPGEFLTVVFETGALQVSVAESGEFAGILDVHDKTL